MKTFKTDGIILKSTPFFERDKKIEFMSEDLGKITVLAKYAMGKRFKGSGKLEPLNFVCMTLIQGKSFLILKETSLIQSFHHLKQDFNTLSLSLYFIELLRICTVQNQKNPELFQLLNRALSSLTQSSDIHFEKQQFQNDLLRLEGILSESETMNDSVFVKKFEEYCGKRPPQPTLFET